MTSIDELFKGLPSKRKAEPLRDPNQVYKSAKLAQVEDEADDEADDDTEAGPALPPPDGEDDDGDYGPAMPDDGDDDEGRFFGGGVTAQESRALDYINEAGDDLPEEKIDAAWLKKTALKFEQRINKNAAQRAKYEDDPARFIQSEADLDADIRALSILGEHPELYPDLARLGTAASLVGLLAHDNADIAIGAIEIIGELTDEDVAAEEDQWDALVGALLEADLVGLLVSNLRRLDEDSDDEADRTGVYHALSVVENLCSNAATAEKVARDDGLLGWLLARIQKKEKATTQNKQYAAEILAILVQTSPANRQRLAGRDAVDAVLQLLAAYRRLDPDRGHEEEYMENLFEALACVVDEPDGKARFVEAEGVELCLIMLKEGRKSRPAALRVLDHAAGGPAGGEVCRRLVEAGGLKTLFTAFMKKGGRDHNTTATTEHLVSIFSWMLRLLPADSAERVRLLVKFVEKDFEKTERLVGLRRDVSARLRRVDEEMGRENRARGDMALTAGEMEEERFLRRLEEGLFLLQSIDLVLAWLIAEDDGARDKIRALLADRGETFDVVRASLRERLDAIGDKTSQAGRDTAEMLATLMEFL